MAWFSPVDYEILGFFEDCDILASPKVIGANIDYDRQYVSKRCQVLVVNNLLERPSEGMYKLSALGRDFLNGDIDSESIERE